MRIALCLLCSHCDLGCFRALSSRVPSFPSLTQRQGNSSTAPVTTPSSPLGRCNMPAKSASALEELLTTEQAYVETLDQVKQFYATPIATSPIFGAGDADEIFVNLDRLIEFHHRFNDELLQAHLGARGSVADCFVRNQTAFSELYSDVVSLHPRALERLGTLMEDPAAHAFLKRCSLLRGTGLSVEADMLVPVQRICKYPLLLKGVYKQFGGTDEAFKAAWIAMRSVAEGVNEDKRRMESMEMIDSWQATVEGWAGPNLRDTSERLILNSPVQKFTLSKSKKSNANDRWLFLFDGVIIYCKRTTLHRARSRRGSIGAGAFPDLDFVFKGRIPTQYLSFVSLADGSAHLQTSGSPVTHAFKISNSAKNKWYVISCKTAEVKDQWMKALHDERQRQDRLRDIHSTTVSLEKEGAALQRAALDASVGSLPLIRDQKYHLTTYKQCFQGRDLVTFLVEQCWRGIKNPEQAIAYAQALLESGKIQHVVNKHMFENSRNFFCFRSDSTTPLMQHIFSDAVQLYRCCHRGSDCVQDHSQLRKTYPSSFLGTDFVDVCIERGFAPSRDHAVLLGQALLEAGFLDHVTREHGFKDKPLLYQFVADAEDQLADGTSFAAVATPAQEPGAAAGRDVVVEFSDDHGYGLDLASTPDGRLWIKTVSAASPAELAGLVAGDGLLELLGQPCPDLVEAKQTLQDAADATKKLTLRVAPRPTATSLPPVCSAAASSSGSNAGKMEARSYKYTSRTSRSIKAVDTLSEGPFTYSLAAEILRLFLGEDRRSLDMLAKLDCLPPRLESGCSTAEQVLRERVQEYLGVLRYLSSKSAASDTFRASTTKTDAQEAFTPINLHVQQLQVFGDRDVPATYTWMTCGAFAAHGLGFSGVSSWKSDIVAETTGSLGWQAEKIIKRLEAIELSLDVAIAAMVSAGTAPDEAQRSQIAAGARVACKQAGRLRQLINQSHRSDEDMQAIAAPLDGAIADLSACVGDPQGDVARRRLVLLLRHSRKAAEELFKDSAISDALAEECFWLPRRGQDTCRVGMGRQHREDVVFVQGVTTLITGFAAVLRAEIQRTQGQTENETESEWLGGLEQLGIFAVFHSFLSAGGEEAGMLADYHRAVERLSTVKVSLGQNPFVSPGDEYELAVDGGRGELLVSITMDSASFEVLPDTLQAGVLLGVDAVLFNEGINEVQTRVQQMDLTWIQTDVNTASLTRIRAFAQRYRGALLERVAFGKHKASSADIIRRERFAAKEARVEQLLQRLSRAVGDGMGVNGLAEEVARALDGLVFLSCKSGKDRTAMAVTLSQVSILAQHHGLPAGSFNDALAVLRSEGGVRLANVRKNTGRSVFAFNDSQVQDHLPKLFGPPVGSYGNNVT
eukprot:m.193505 g.193505  ORF g.193505 m.193505 type:complete len:1365 (-) comp18294_c0_seq6:248-4342(-)